jgi:hypothetical protein
MDDLSSFPNQAQEHSLVIGGPVFRFWRSVGLSGDQLERVQLRMLSIGLFLWLPLMVLALYEGNAWGGNLKIPLLSDISTYARLIISVPILVGAEVFVHRNIGNRVRLFLARGIVSDRDMQGFQEAVNSAARIRNSALLELSLLFLAYVVGGWFWRNHVAIGDATWYASPDGTHLNLTLAGYWFAFVSLPIAQFILLRWYSRFFVWAWFLFRVSRLKLRLIPTHPDRSAGLSFLGKSTYAFAPVLFAQGVLLSGFIASEVVYSGRNLMEFKLQAAGFLVVFVCSVLSPLAFFAPALLAAKRSGLSLYGTLASSYVQTFEQKWIKGHNPANEVLLGSGDIQSLADLGNSYAVVREMNIIPFEWKDVARLAGVAAAPLLPLALLAFSAEELFDKIVMIVFG